MELKPCPFCGKKAKFGLAKKRGCQLHGNPIQEITVSCVNQLCPAKPSIVGECRYRGFDYPKFEEQAKEQSKKIWNYRPDNNIKKDGLVTKHEEEK